MPAQFEILTFGFGSTVTILLLTTGHWMPWTLSRIQAYIYGTVAIWIGFTIWRLPLGDWLTPLGFLVISILGGVTVKLAYSTDYVVKRMRQAEMHEAIDDEL